jgi:hypothetical protein
MKAAVSRKIKSKQIWIVVQAIILVPLQNPSGAPLRAQSNNQSKMKKVAIQNFFFAVTCR